MKFWGKKENIVLDCYTANPYVYNYAPIKRAHAYRPKWTKNVNVPPEVEMGARASLANVQSLDGFVDSNNLLPFHSTISTCPGIKELYSHGIIMPMWTDVAMYQDENCFFYRASDSITEVVKHPLYQFGKMFQNKFDDKLAHFKIESPWYFECNDNVSFLVQSCCWDLEIQDFANLLSGVTDYHSQGTTNVNLMFTKSKNERIIPFETPLLHFIPLSERKLEVRVHLISDEEMKRKRSAVEGIKFRNKLSQIRKKLLGSKFITKNSTTKI